MAGEPRPPFSPLTQDTQADAVIIGAGIAGLTTAYQLQQAGQSVVVLETGPLASGETERTTAHLSCALDDRFTELERLHGPRGARIAAESHAAAITAIEHLAKLENIECDFMRLDGYLFGSTQSELPQLQAELAAAHRAGLSDVELVTRAPLAHFHTGRALRFPRQAQFHPLKYLSGLARVIARDGGRIFTHTHVDHVQSGKPARVRTANGCHVNAASVVVATNSPVNDRVAVHTKQAPYRTYVIGARVPRDSVPVALYWDTADPYHYVRLQRSGPDANEDILIVGGEDHKTGQAEDYEARYARLEKWTRERFAINGVSFRWSGQVMEPIDGLGFIGRNPVDTDNIYIATGDSGHGMTHGTIAGMLITDLIMGRNNAWASVYSPGRVTTGAAPEFAMEGLNLAAQYTDWLTPGTVREEREVPVDSGAIMRRGLTKVALYRDANGQLHECSAVCPHLGGIVHWNGNEKMWECPVHGSRFDRFGKVVNGPAISDLVSGRAQPVTPR